MTVVLRTSLCGPVYPPGSSVLIRAKNVLWVDELLTALFLLSCATTVVFFVLRFPCADTGQGSGFVLLFSFVSDLWSDAPCAGWGYVVQPRLVCLSRFWSLGRALCQCTINSYIPRGSGLG